MKKYVLITGGELFNKGAQAMTFVTVDEIKKRYPEFECVLFSNQDAKRSKEERAKYRFRIARRPRIREMLSLCVPGLRRVFAHKGYYKIYKNAACQIDISGYALGSNWGIKKCLTYVMSIRLAKAFGIPVYLMPQSFGPFEFKGFKGRVINSLIKRYMKYPTMIMAREDEGRQLLVENYGLGNVVHTNDLVLQNKRIEPKNIYRKLPQSKKKDISQNAVAIIPNIRNNKYGDAEEVHSTYISIINLLLSKGRSVCLMYHSQEDRELCLQLKNDFSDNKKVDFLDEELSCLEFDETVQNFDFIIASRFHSIVHAYKNAVPAVIMGWAVKYNRLAALFDQEKYQYDVRGGLEEASLLKVIGEMDISFKKESDHIRENLVVIQSENVYDNIRI